MNPRDLLATSRLLLDARRGKPSGACLCRALSGAYYALFHHLAGECANLWIGTKSSLHSKEAWRQVYRALEHVTAKEKCRNKALTAKFPDAIQDFANLFVSMQVKRHLADYDPYFRVRKSEVAEDVLLVERAIVRFSEAPLKDRRAFCAYILLKVRKDDDEIKTIKARSK